MIECQMTESPRCGVLTLRPNAAMPWRYNLYVIGLFSLGILGFGIFWTTQGVVLALPFGVLEVIGLTAALWWVAHKAQRVEVLELTELEVVFRSGIKTVEREFRAPRLWTQIDIQPAKRKIDAPRVFLCFRDQRVEVGDFLNRRDRYRLIRQLKQLVNGPKRLADSE